MGGVHVAIRSQGPRGARHRGQRRHRPRDGPRPGRRPGPPSPSPAATRRSPRPPPRSWPSSAPRRPCVEVDVTDEASGREWSTPPSSASGGSTSCSTTPASTSASRRRTHARRVAEGHRHQPHQRLLCSQAAYPHMKQAGGGKIINIGSMTLDLRRLVRAGLRRRARGASSSSPGAGHGLGHRQHPGQRHPARLDRHRADQKARARSVRACTSRC